MANQQDQIAQVEDLRDRAHRRRRDVSTVISMLPYPLDEKKPGLVPGIFVMPPAKKNDVELLVVERCVHAVYLDESRPRLIVPDPSDMVAESIVRDHKTSIHGYVSGVAEPGIEWVEGEFPNTRAGKELLAAQHHALLKGMHDKQLKWFEFLVQFADDDWSRFKMHKFITALQRTAANTLGLEREWLTANEIVAAASKCKFCFQMVHPDAIVCGSCHGVLNMVAYQANFVAAGSTPPALVGGVKPPTT